ncbi:hypothetical protein [Rhizobium laguerreae]|uniref:hypothetical protein n=1 Tax=Rhizobium laguerreae TaxID=1076926 RepID=UPI001C8FA70C|nr:hypothetical protein [Rhizobium laguerreae]MBY3211484.1 hypothetical protein [Rhizobium laguerreae]
MRRGSYTIEQIDPPERVSVPWRYNDALRKWEIGVNAPAPDGVVCGTRGVNNKLLSRNLKDGPGTEEFSKAVVEITVDAVELVNHLPALKAFQDGPMVTA